MVSTLSAVMLLFAETSVLPEITMVSPLIAGWVPVETTTASSSILTDPVPLRLMPYAAACNVMWVRPDHDVA